MNIKGSLEIGKKYRLVALTLWMAISVLNGHAQTPSLGDYHSVTSGNWSDLATWQRFDGTNWATPTALQGYPGQNAGTDDVWIQDGHTVTIDVSPAQPISGLLVGQGTSGILQYEANNAQTLTVSGIVTISQGGVFCSASTGTVTTHQLVVESGIVNQGTLNFSNNTAGVGITFSGNSNGLFDLSAATRTNLMASNGLILDKGNNVLSFTPGGIFQVLSANTTGFLTIQSGTFSLMGANSFSNPLFYASTGSYTIPFGGGFTLNNHNASISGIYGTLTNNGSLIIRDGVFNVGDGTGNESLTTSTGRFEMSGGEMNISGRFRIDGGNCLISGGVLNLATIGHANRTLAAFHISGSAGLTISGDPLITFAFPNSNTTPFNDIEIVAGIGIKTITGGTFQMGTAATPASRPFLVNSDIPLYNLVVYSANTRVVLSDQLTINNQLTLNGQLMMNNFDLNLGTPEILGDHRSGHGMIITSTGEIHKTITAADTYIFPFGTGGSSGTYIPVTLNFTGGTFSPGASVSVGMAPNKHPQNVNTTNFLRRYWTVQTTGITNPVYNFTGSYITGDVVGNDAFILTGVYTTFWTKRRSPLNAALSITANGLTGNAAITGINAAAPGVTVTATPATVCSGSTVQLTAIATGDGPFTYSWTPTADLNNRAIYNPVATPTVTVPTTITYTVTVTDGMGESVQRSATVTVNPSLPVSVTIVSSDSDNIICAGQSVTFTATAENAGTPTYQWYVGSTPVGSNSPEYTTTTLISGQAVSVVMTTTAACDTGSPATSNAITTTVNPQLPVSITIDTPDNSVCAGTAVTFTAHPVNPGDAPVYQWRVNGGVVGENDDTYIYTPIDGDIVTCTLTNDAICSTGSPAISNTLTMQVFPLPTATMAGTTDVCINETAPGITFTGATGTAPYTFTYRINNGANQTVTSTGNMATVTAPTGTIGDFIYTLLSIQDANCTQLQEGNATITVHPLPVATAGSNSPQCVGGRLELSATGGTSYSWTGPNGFTSTQQNPVIASATTAAAGTYTVRVTDANGCQATASTTVIINPAPTVSITANPGGTICSGTTVSFTARFTNAGTNPTFQWQVDGVEVTGVTGSTFSTATLSNGQRVRVIITADPAYCSSTAVSNIITMTVNNPVTPTVSILESANNICDGTSVTFTSVVANGGSAPTYQWQINGTDVPAANGSSFSSSNLNDGDQVRVIVTSNAACVTSSTATSNVVIMVVNPIVIPSVTIAANPATAVCPGTAITFTATPANGGSTPVYQWRVNNNPVGSNSSTFTSSTLVNNDVVSVRMTSNASCVLDANALSNNITVTVNPGTPALPGAITGNILACPNSSETYTISQVTNATSYNWTSPAGWTIISGQGTNSITVTTGNTGQNGSITVTASNSCGTSGTRTLAVSTGSLSTASTGVIIVNNNTCLGTSKTLTISGGSLGTGAIWEWFTGSCGETLAGTGPSISVNPPSGTIIYYVRARGNCNITQCAEGTVIVSPGAPAQPMAITGGATPVCPGTSLTYSIPAVADATSYNWTVPTGWNITAGQGTTSITVTAGAAGQNGNISVIADNSCGSSIARTLAVTVAPGAPATPGAIAGVADQCINSSGRVFSVAPVANATSYSWTLPSGWAITAGSGTNSITVTTNGSASSGNITVIANNSCGSSTASAMAVNIVTNIPNTPGAITGLEVICPAKTTSYSIAPVPGATNYTWSIPGSWRIISGQGTTSINVEVLMASVSGTISVTANNVCGSSPVRTQSVIVTNSTSVYAGSDRIVCYGTSFINLAGSVQGLNNHNQWDWILLSGGNVVDDRSLTTRYNFPNGATTTGTLRIQIRTNVSVVGCEPIQDEMTITILPLPDASLAVTGPNPICSGSSSTITFTGTPNTTVTYTVSGTPGSSSINIGTSGTATLTTATLTAPATTYTITSASYTTAPNCSNIITGKSATVNVNQTPTVNAGTTIITCQSAIPSAIPLTGATIGGDNVTGAWSIVSGGGTLSNTAQTATPATVTYTPAPNFSGAVTLMLTTNAPVGCTPVNATRTINVNAAPTVNAGETIVVCQSTTPSAITLSGATIGGGATTAAWSIISGGGTLSNTAQTGTPATVTYTPAPNFSGSVTLMLTTNAPVGCAPGNATRTITINPLVTVNAGADQTVCATSTVALTGTISGPVSAGTWSGGSGSFSNQGSLNTIYTPSEEEISDGTVTLTLTSDDPAGPCNPVSDQVTITITPSPTVNAGVDQSICEGSPVVLSGSRGGAAASATWTTSGGGTFTPSNTTMNATYTPGVGETGDVTLTLTTDDPAGSCNAVSDQMVIHIYPRATVNAGPNQTICSNGTATMAGSFGGSASSGRWTTSGGGTFTNPTSPSAVYTPGNSDIASGSVTLTFTTDDPEGPCGPVSASMTLTINHAIQITSQPSNTGVCATYPANLTVTAVGDNPTYQWYRGVAPTGTAVVNSTNITGAQSSTLHFNNATSVDEGTYYVVISGANQCVSVTSNMVTLNVDQEITITRPFQSTTVCVGDDVTFSIEAEPGGLLTFQWRKDGVNIDGATGNTLTLNDVTLANGGVYDVMIAGLAGYTCTNAQSAPATLTVTPDVETPIFTVGPTSIRCQGAGTVSYLATANHSTGITYSLDNASVTGGNTINAATGAVTFAAGWAGTTTITASAAGCNGPSAATHTVTVTPTVTIAPFAASTSTRCQGAGTVTYSTTANNSTGITYSLDATTGAYAGNFINASTGAVTFAAGWAGTTTITASAAGCNGPAITTHTVTVTPTVTITPFAAPTSSRCQGAGTVTYTTTATNNSSAIVYSLDNASVTGGNTINANTGAVTFAAGWSGTTTITASAAGCNGPATATHTVTVTPTVTIAPFIPLTSTRCQGAGTVTYTTTATNNSSAIVYSLDNASVTGGNTINANTGAVTFAVGWSGTTTITATAQGCNGPATATHTVTVTPTVTIAPFISLTSNRCQGAGTATYTTTATNNSSAIVYSLDATTAGFAGNSINSSTGAVTFAAGWSGTTTITATAQGCNGPATATHRVTVTPTVTIAPFAILTSTRCQGAGTATYSTTATNSTGITYTLDAASLAGGNTINAITGAVIFNANWNGTTTITASAAGCNGPVTTTHTVITEPTSVGGTLSPYTHTVCTTSNSGSLTLSGYIGTILRWESSTNAGGAWTQIPNTSSSYNYSNLPLTTIFRAVVKSGACSEVYSAPARVVVIPLFEPVITATTVDICNGNSTRLSVSTSLLQPVGAFYGGSFNQANPPGWRISENGSFIGFPAAANNTNVGPWSETNGPKTFNGISYSNLDGKFAVVNGVIRSTMETPVFNLFGLPSAALTFTQAYNILPGTTARIELSTDGGNSYNIVLATYTGSLHGGNPNVINPVNIDMSPYLGMMNLRIRFNYIGTNGSSWAVEGISIPSQQTDVTYTWAPAETLSSTTDSVVIATPGVTTTYTLTMMVSGCPVIAKSIVIGVANPPVVQTTNACIGAGPVTFTQTGGTLGGTWRVTGGGTINATGVFTPATPGCFDASYITPSGICGDTVSFMVFPAAPLPVVNMGCGPIVITPPAAIPGFTLQYSFDNGATWGGSTPPTAENCAGYQIRTRYITTLTCSAVGENPASTIPGCDMSPAVTRIVDLTPPAITCPTNITASTNADACYATLVLTPPVVTDNCTAASAITVTSNAPAQYPVGQTIVTWTAVDACGNQSTCTQTITVTDNNQPPVFTTCPPDQEQTALPNNCVLYDIVLTEPVAADNCGVDHITYTTTGATTLISPQTGMNYVSGQDLNVGITTITYIAYDAAGNASPPCSFTVTVLDVTPPKLTIGGCVDVSELAAANYCSKIPVTLIDPTYSDDCWPRDSLTLSWTMSGATTGSGIGSVVGRTFNVGVTTVTYEVEDPDGNTATCSFDVTILDVTPPNLTIGGCEDVTESVAANNCSKIPVTLINPTYSDDCWPIDSLTLSWTMSGATTRSGTGSVVGQTFNVGLTTVTYEVEDPDGNTATCSFDITILRLNIPPAAITCSANPDPVTAVAGTCFAPVIVASPVEVDPCETVTYTFINDFNNTDNASDSYPVGSTIVNWTIIDNSGDTITCQQTVVVNDLPPTITCPASIVVQADFELPYQDAVIVPQPTYGDNCPNPDISWTMLPPAAYAAQYAPGALSGTGPYPSPSIFYLGVTTITYTVTDANGNRATCSFTISVLAEPEITCLPAVSYNTDAGQCTATRNSTAYGLPTLVTGLQPITWTWTITDPDGSQGATGTFIGNVATPGPPSIPDYAFQQGTSTITWRAENVSGFDDCTQSIIVIDNQPPTFTVPDALTECVESLTFAVYDRATIDISPERPDYYILESGSEVLDITGLTDNCCDIASMTIHWRIDLSGGSNNITGTGQPSTYGSDISLPGDVAPYDDDLVHLISYWIEDCHGQISPVQTQNIIIRPRPNLTKVN